MQCFSVGPTLSSSQNQTTLVGFKGYFEDTPGVFASISGSKGRLICTAAPMLVPERLGCATVDGSPQ
jgi:hypothetical protein